MSGRATSGSVSVKMCGTGRRQVECKSRVALTSDIPVAASAWRAITRETDESSPAHWSLVRNSCPQPNHPNHHDHMHHSGPQATESITRVSEAAEQEAIPAYHGACNQ